MLKTPSILKEIKLVGIKTRTNNEQERNWMEGKIFPCVQKYFHQQLANNIPNRVKPGTTLCIYTEYESDHTGPYTYFIGEQVSSIENISSEFETLIIPEQQYAKFTPPPGQMPHVLRDAWEKIWKMGPKDFGGERGYLADFEVYDERATDHNNLILDIYIGIK
jgi:predicted transcriptional regulator YdeE